MSKRKKDKVKGAPEKELLLLLAEMNSNNKKTRKEERVNIGIGVIAAISAIIAAYLAYQTLWFSQKQERDRIPKVEHTFEVRKIQSGRVGILVNVVNVGKVEARNIRIDFFWLDFRGLVKAVHLDTLSADCMTTFRNGPNGDCGCKFSFLNPGGSATVEFLGKVPEGSSLGTLRVEGEGFLSRQVSQFDLNKVNHN